jgi:hypothetical protein
VTRPDFWHSAQSSIYFEKTALIIEYYANICAEKYGTNLTASASNFSPLVVISERDHMLLKTKFIKMC